MTGTEFTQRCYRLADRTIARMPARIALGNAGQAATTLANSGYDLSP